MKPYSKIFILRIILVLLITTTGCYDKVNSPAPEFDTKPVVNAIIVAGNEITVRVSLAVPFSSKKVPVVDNAEVLLYVNNELTDPLEHIGEGVYESQLVAQEETEYRCEVTIPGYPPATGSAFIPKHQDVSIVEHINFSGTNEEGVPYPAIKISFDNQPNKLQYFQVVIMILEDDYTSTQKYSSPIIDPVLLSERLSLLVFSNKTIQGNSCKMTINYNNGRNIYWHNGVIIQSFMPIQVELRSITYDYYKYVRQLYLYEMSNGDINFSPNTTPTFKLHSNIKNGYGIFAGYSSTNSEIFNP